MRNLFVDHLMQKTKQGETDRCVLLTGDLGFSVLEPLREAWGPRFINAGVAEALMTSMAAGIADQGYRVFTYSITPFATFRCLEQIRNDVCYHKLDVSIVGIGAGFGYGALGATHHATDDLAVMWTLPNLNVFCPADLNEAWAVYEYAWSIQGPKYYRLGKGKEGKIDSSIKIDLKDSLCVEYRKGSQVTLISSGNILAEVIKAADLLSNERISVQVISCPILKPFPSKNLFEKISSRRVLVVEEHVPYGGFSNKLASEALKNGFAKNWDFQTMSCPDVFASEVGSMDHQRKTAGIDASAIAQAIRNNLNEQSATQTERIRDPRLPINKEGRF